MEKKRNEKFFRRFLRPRGKSPTDTSLSIEPLCCVRLSIWGWKEKKQEEERKNNGNLANLRVEGNGRLLSHELSSSSPFSYKIVVRSIQRAYSPYSIGVVFLRFSLFLSLRRRCARLCSSSPYLLPLHLGNYTATPPHTYIYTSSYFALLLSLSPLLEKIKYKITFFFFCFFNDGSFGRLLGVARSYYPQIDRKCRSGGQVCRSHRRSVGTRNKKKQDHTN